MRKLTLPDRLRLAAFEALLDRWPVRLVAALHDAAARLEAPTAPEPKPERRRGGVGRST